MELGCGDGIGGVALVGIVLECWSGVHRDVMLGFVALGVVGVRGVGVVGRDTQAGGKRLREVVRITTESLVDLR